MYINLIPTMLLFAVCLVFVSPLAAQSTFEFADSSPVLGAAELPVDNSTFPSQFGGAPTPIPAPTEPQSAGFRRTIQDVSKHKHQYIHCRLKSGKILTGQIENVEAEYFTVQTDVLGGPQLVKYDALAESPRAVPALGTRFKQGAQWVGVGALVAVAVPVLIVLSPLLYLSGAWVC